MESEATTGWGMVIDWIRAEADEASYEEREESGGVGGNITSSGNGGRKPGTQES